MKKTILITGAGSGLGKGTAIGLAKNGHNVIAGVQNSQQLSILQKETELLGINIEVIKLDVLDESDRENAAKFDIDILVNNAGVSETGSICEQSVDSIKRVFEVNVFGNLSLTQKIVQKMLEQKKQGKIIWMSSASGLFVTPFAGAYCGSKFAIEAIASAMYKELKPLGIKVATINPGAYKTGFNDKMLDMVLQGYDPKKSFIKREQIDEVAAGLETQYDPQEMIDVMVELIPQDNHKYRTVKPENWEEFLKQNQKEIWDLEI